MRILVTFAVDAEFAPWRKLRRFAKREQENWDFYSIKIADCELNVLMTGIGGKKAWVEAARGLWGGEIDLCVSSGLAGALKVEHKVGEVLVAESVYAADWKTAVSCDSRLVADAAACGAKVVKHFYSADHVVIRAEEKQALGLRADAVDMESAEVLSEAAAFGAKAIAIRGISDAADEDLPLDFDRVTTDSGDVSMKRVLGQVAQNPWAVPSLIRFGRQSRMAAEKLAGFLDRYVSRLATTDTGGSPLLRGALNA
jgi:adenosylhomocysteine nucleosidase